MPIRARDAFTSTLNNGNKRANTAPEATQAKIQIRELVLQQIGAGRAHVFDAFAGEGELYKAVWKKAASYVGCDSAGWYRDERVCYVCDNRRVMRAIDLAPFTIFDLDAWGSPWEQATILAARRSIAPGERIGLCLTEGSGLRLKMGWVPDALALISGLRRHMPGVARNQADIIERALSGLCRRMGCRIVSRWQAKGRKASSLYYIGLVLEGTSTPSG